MNEKIQNNEENNRNFDQNFKRPDFDGLLVEETCTQTAETIHR